LPGTMKETSPAEWIEEELMDVDFGDRRLSKRCKLLLGRLATDPQASINGACHGWAESVAAYRFFNHEAVNEEKVLAPHRRATLRRMEQHPVVLLIQDTTELDYTREDLVVAGAGPLNEEERIGFLDHVQVALTPERLPLGVIRMQIWARDWETFRTCKERKYDPIETKESYRWVEGYREACRVAAEVPQTQIISVADSESDIYECFLEAQAAGTSPPAEWLIRASENRSLPERDEEAGPYCYRTLWDTMDQSPVLGTRRLKIPKTPKRKARKAKITIRAEKIHLRPPYRRGIRLPEIALHVILVREEKPPAGEEPIEWLLLTSLPIETLAEVLLVIGYYACRWQIEVFFRVFKTGCKVEQIQLEREERLRPCLALYKIVAWRVLYVTMLGREAPDLPCDVLFTAEEWKSAWMVCNDRKPPKRPPLLKVFLPMIAKLGGYNGRKHDGPPGPKAMWIAIRRITDFGLAWSTFGPKEKKRV
jgi:hypothetical protein